MKEIISASDIQAKVKELAHSIDNDGYDNLLVVPVLQGAVFFFADLVRQMKTPCQFNFIGPKSYIGTQSTGHVHITKGLGGNLSQQHILLVEDIIDTGHTLHRITKDVLARQPASLRICCLLDKPGRREVEVSVDYIGFKVEDRFLVGYGLDFDEQYRNLSSIREIE